MSDDLLSRYLGCVGWSWSDQLSFGKERIPRSLPVNIRFLFSLIFVFHSFSFSEIVYLVWKDIPVSEFITCVVIWLWLWLLRIFTEWLRPWEFWPTSLVLSLSNSMMESAWTQKIDQSSESLFSFCLGKQKEDTRPPRLILLLGKFYVYFTIRSPIFFISFVIFIFRARRFGDCLAMAMLTAYPIRGCVSDGLFPICVERITAFGAYFNDAIVRFYMKSVSKYDEHVYDNVSDGQLLFQLVEHTSVVLRPLVHPLYYKTLKRWVFRCDEILLKIWLICIQGFLRIGIDPIFPKFSSDESVYFLWCPSDLSCKCSRAQIHYVDSEVSSSHATSIRYSCSQPLYRIIGQSLTVTFLTKFCERVERPSEFYPLERSDFFFKAKVSPSSNILKDLRLIVDPVCVFSGYDLFGMTYSDFKRRQESSDIRTRDLAHRD